MRSIDDVLKLFSSNYNMDYCEDFDIIKSVLDYCNENLKQLNRIQILGDNKKIIEEIVNRIRSHLTEKKYYDNENKPNQEFDQEFRKITFFLVLNTDATFKYNLKSDPKLCHLLDVIPQLPKCLLIYSIWGLHLEKYFYEILAYSPCWFSLQFCEPAVASMKHLGPYEVLEKVEQLVKSIFISICRADLLNLDVIDKKRIFEKFCDYVMELLRQFYTPDSEKFSNWTKKKFYKYSGFTIRHLLDMILFCFGNYEKFVKVETDEKYKIYSICTEMCPISGEERKQYSDLIRENQTKILVALLNSLEYCVMLVTIDVFMYWVEVDLTPDSTLQAAIGERAYKVLELMASNKVFKHHVGQQLKYIAIEPKSLETIIKDATIGEILNKLDNCEGEYTERKMWFDELISRSLALLSMECLETIRANTKLITVENFHQMMDYFKLQLNVLDEMIAYDDEHEALISILIKSLQNFNSDQLIEIIQYKVQQFGVDFTLFEKSDLEERSTEFFNKWVENVDVQEFLKLCFENPRLLFEQFLNEAYNSEKQIKNFCSTLVKTKKVSNVFFEELLNKSITSKYAEKLYPNLIYEMYQTDMIDKEYFFKKFVYSNVVIYLDAMNLEPLLAMLKALMMIANKSQATLGFAKFTAPVLVMAGQIMEKCRWDMISYSDLKEEIVKLCVDFVQIVSKKFLPVASERDKAWISEKVAKFRPINKYYFQKFSLDISEQPKTFDKFLHASDFENKSEIEKFLTSTYVRCTTKETEWLARCELFLPHISDVILIIEGIVKELGNDAISNFRHCVINYAHILKKFCFPSVGKSHEKVSELAFKILNIVASAPIVIYDELFMIFHSILLELLQQIEPIQGDLIKEVEKFVSDMKDCRGKEVFVEKLNAMTIEMK